MPNNKPSKKQLEELAKEIKQDQAKSSPAEKRLKIGTSFKNAVKKIVRSRPPKKKSK